MITPEFIHLRVHTAYSLLEGAIKIPKLVHWAVDEKMPAIAMTDSGNVFGAMMMSKECADNGVQPIIGAQLLVRTPPRPDDTLGQDAIMFDKVVVLVQNAEGYQNLLYLFSLYYMGAEKQITPHITLEELASKSAGLILLTGGIEGPLGRQILADHISMADDILHRLMDAFPNRLYIELQRHGLPDEQRAESAFLDLAYKYNIPVVATNEAFFKDPDMYEAHDALICIAEKTYVTEQNRRRVTPEHYLKTADQMKELFSDIPEAISNTVKIAQRCYFMVDKKKPAFPKYDCKGKTEDEVLREMSEAGLKKRMIGRDEDEIKKYTDRMNYELGVIQEMKFPGYFLIVADFIQWSKSNGVAVGPGRGSGAGSVVAWALTITNIDPMRFNLLFERFLNPERVSMPDFDVDFCQENRGKTIEYVQNHYGFDHVAQIITFGQLQAKAVIRDVGRVLQVPYPVVDRLSKLVPNKLGITLKEAIEQEERFGEMASKEEIIKQLLEIALKLEGLYRNASTHAAGVVIGDRPLEQIVPIYKDPSSEMPVTQFNMKFVEDASLIKFDFLGLKTLTTIEKTIGLLRVQNIQLDVDINDLPLDDAKTFALLQAADSTGVFQLESPGMKQVLHDMKPDKFEDLIALVSLYRPGPMASIPDYIACKKGEKEPDYMDPMLETILKETYGIMIYQEQVMQISQVMAGYTLGGADLLRRAMGKKIKAEMDKQRDVFIDGAVKNNVKRSVAEGVFDKMAKFAEYGFNKSHAAAYAYIAYQTAYLKAHYPVEFMAATMTLDKFNTDKLDFFKNDVNKMGITVLPPDINKSGVDFTEENGAIRYALSAVKNVGEASMREVVVEREKNGAFQSIEDFFRRVDITLLNKRYVEHLIKSGSFDSIEPNRAMLLENMDNLLAYANNASVSRKSSQISLFGGDTVATTLKITQVPDWPQIEKLAHEKEGLGLYLSAHPLDSYDAVFERLRVVNAADIEAMVQLSGAARVQVGAVVSSVKEKISQKGNKFAFITASDKSGTYELMCFSDVLTASREKLNSGQPLLLTITADKKEGDERMRMLCQNVEYLSDVMANTATTLILNVENPASLADVKALLDKDEKGKSKVFLILKTSEHQVEITLADKYKLLPETMDKLNHLTTLSGIKCV